MIKPSKLISITHSLCPICKKGITAHIVERDEAAYMEKECSEHGHFEVKLASNAKWYRDRVTEFPSIQKRPPQKKPVARGCPYDCGACGAHEQNLYLPVIAITSACNLNCPICYTINKNDEPFHMSLEEFRQILLQMRSFDPDKKIINITGGEPTCHPQLRALIQMCHDEGIHRITVSTHGLTFLKDESLLADLAALNTRIVLSFNSFHESVNREMNGADLYKAKKRVLDLLEKYDVDTTLIPVLARGVNDQELGDLVRLVLSKPFIRSLEVHTMTYAGQGGADFNPKTRMTAFEVIEEIVKQTNGLMVADDFLPSPCAHPLCYQTGYLLETPKGYIPFARFMSREVIRALLTDSIYMEPSQKTEEILLGVITDLWANQGSDGMDFEMSDNVIATLKNLIRDVYQKDRLSYEERQQRAERSAKTLYIHAHMDVYNFDTERVRQCCVGVPSPDGEMIPTCSYNVLYREQDSRFTKYSTATKPIALYPGGYIKP